MQEKDEYEIGLEKARAFFDRAEEVASTSNFDYGIDLYLEGLQLSPDALEDGHIPLRRLALKRQGNGGKKPTMMEKMKRVKAKGPKEDMLNAEFLLAKDPDNLQYAETMIKSAIAGGFLRTAEWLALLMFDANRASDKPSFATYILLKDCFIKMKMFTRAVTACECALQLRPKDDALRDELRDLSASMTMEKGNYGKTEDFRGSIRNKEAQEKLHRQAFEIENLSFGYDGGPKLFNNFDLSLNAGDRLAVIGENGVGKSTLLKLLVGDLTPQHGEIRWTEKARFGYYAQDHAEDFKSDTPLTEWVAEFARANAAEGEDLDTLIRGTLGRLLFSGDEVRKPVNVISGGEQGRLIFGKLMLMKPNVLIMDEPTNHLDMESIESLNTALEKFKGTLVFVSHDREFVSSLATRILEIRTDGTIVNYLGTYEEYLASQGIE